jgi:hypothetical protein
MYCRNYTGTVSHVLCREVGYTVSLFGTVDMSFVERLIIQYRVLIWESPLSEVPLYCFTELVEHM